MKAKCFRERIKKFLLITFPVAVIILILFISSWLFDLNREQTYQRVRELEESYIQTLAAQVDHVTQQNKLELTSGERDMIETTVTEMNKKEGVYCFLYDKNCNLISNYEDSPDGDVEIANKVRFQIENNEIYNIDTHGSCGWFDIVSPVNGKYIKAFWQGIPSSPDRSDCDYFIVMTVSRVKVNDNQIIDVCKSFIGVLTIILVISLYDSIYCRSTKKLCTGCNKKNKGNIEK